MFSQWIQAVENLAQHSPKSSQDLSAEARQARPSLDKARRGSQSSLNSQRPASPAGRPTDGGPRPRSTLEDRIRAKLANAEASNAGTPSSSSATRSNSTTGPDFPLSPASTPLPDSPALSTGSSGDPLKGRSLSPADPQTTQPEIRSPVPATSRHGYTAGVDAVWHPLSPTSAPLPDSPPVSPTLDTSHPATTTSLHSLVTDGSLQESPEATGHGLEMEDAPDAKPAMAPSPSPVLQQDELLASIPETKPTTETTNLEAGTTSGAVAVDTESSDVEPAAPADDHTNTTGSKIESEEIHPSPVDVPLLTVPPAEPDTPQSTTTAQALDSVPSEVPSLPDTPADTVLPPRVPTESAAPSLGEPEPRAALPSQNVPDKPAIQLVSQDASEFPSVDTPRTALPSTPVTPLLPNDAESDGLVEGLQKRLKLVEQRFADVSTSFKRLQAEKLATDKVLQELTPLQSMQEVESLRDYLQNMNMKTEMTQDEIKRLTGKLTRQEERIDELRDIHRLESKSQSDQIDKLKAQIDEAEALLKATQSSTTRAEEESAKRKAEIERLQTDMDRMKGAVKDEEEKRVKAVGLLKTVRQKLVKAEKDRDDALKEILGVRDQGKGELEKERAEKAELKREVERANAERETALSGLKAHFDKEVATLKERHERELAAMKSQFELEAITTKTSLAKDIENRDSRIVNLQSLVRSLEGEKDEFFDQLQLRQAELESSRSRLESLEGQTTEFQYQLREATDRVALLTEELSDARREQETKALNIGPSAEEVSRLLSAAESKYEARISDLRNRLSTVEREREEGEALWSRKLADKSRELDSLREILNSSAKSREQESENVGTLQEEIDRLREDVRVHQLRISDMRAQADRAAESENGFKSQISDLNARIIALQQLVEEGKAREAQLRANNKTLRDELRKVQSSAALLERQRNPGVGYWASRQDVSGERSPRSSMDGRDSPSRPSSPALSQSDEELNIEYLRNVILQFLEHKEMRPHLVRILSTILRFTPQETRRLVSKV